MIFWMTTLVSLLISFVENQAVGEEFSVHALQMKTSEFKSFVEKSKRISFANAFFKKHLLQNLDRLTINSDPSSLRHSLYLLDQLPLRSMEVESAVFLFEKLGIENLSAPEKNRFLGLLTADENSEEKNSELIKKVKKDLSTFVVPSTNDRLSQNEIDSLKYYLSSDDAAVFVDGSPIQSLEQKISSWPHQWVYISNTAYPILVVGYFSDFLSALTNFKSFNDRCGEVIIPWPSLPELKLKNLGVHGDCDENAILVENRQIFEKEKTYLWTVPVAIIAGGLTLSYFKNKQVSLHLPTFKF